MSRMIGPLFEGSPLLLFPLIALALFAAVFVAVVLRLAAQGAARFDAVARSPLDDERIPPGGSAS